ncbi:50S ribosomal protein L17 [Thermodesulfobacteriota bacterium]
MRHRKAGLKLNRTSSHRKAMFRNMVTSLFKHTRIRTTDAKAKELRRWADNLITLAKRGDLHARRQALSIVREKEVVHKLFEEAQEKYGSVSGGYTRVVKVGRRPGDAAPVSIVELIAVEKALKKTRKKKGKAAASSKESDKKGKKETAAKTEKKAAPKKKVTNKAKEKKAEPKKEKKTEK